MSQTQLEILEERVAGAMGCAMEHDLAIWDALDAYILDLDNTIDDRYEALKLIDILIGETCVIEGEDKAAALEIYIAEQMTQQTEMRP